MNDETRITVIDAPMGAGKTTWTINQLCTSTRMDNILYISPFLEEANTIIKKVKPSGRNIVAPQDKGKGKLDNITELMRCSEDIASTHELFKRFTPETKEAVREGHYTLFLDETLDAIQPFETTKRDNIRYLRDKGSITVDDNNFVVWNDQDYSTDFDLIKNMARNHSLFYVNDKLLLWRYPPEIFEIFDRIYIMTYLFESSILKYYFDLHGINYELKSVRKVSDEEYELCDYIKADASIYKDKINIYDGKLNNSFYQKPTSLSKSWFNSSRNADKISTLKKNIYNYFRNEQRVKADDILWTTFKSAKKELSSNGYARSFLSFNSRSTNNYRNRKCLAYAVNVFLHPAVDQFFIQQKNPINQEKYALSEMVQWIFRSQIRDGQPIDIYIPSYRMRTLLIKWLNNEI